jgi:hypothetical protein
VNSAQNAVDSDRRETWSACVPHRPQLDSQVSAQSSTLDFFSHFIITKSRRPKIFSKSFSLTRVFPHQSALFHILHLSTTTEMFKSESTGENTGKNNFEHFSKLN